MNKEGISPNPDKVRAVTESPSPDLSKSGAVNVKLVQSSVGLCSYYRRHVLNFANIARPLTELTKKDAVFRVGRDCDQL